MFCFAENGMQSNYFSGAYTYIESTFEPYFGFQR